MFDVSILFEALSSSFPPHFNKDKTESRIVAATSLSHENTKSFMSSVEWKMKLVYFCSLWIWDNIACLNAFSLLLFVCVCMSAWPHAYTCTCTYKHFYVLLSQLLLSVSSVYLRVWFVWLFGCMLVFKKGCVRSLFTIIRCQCFLTEPHQTIICGCELFMAGPLCKKGTKMPL